MTPKKRSVIKNNILKNNVFTPLELENIKNNVTEEIQINNPIELININIPPEKDERMQYNLPEFLQDRSNEESFGGFDTQEIDIFIQEMRNNPIQTMNSLHLQTQDLHPQNQVMQQSNPTRRMINC